MPAAGQTPSEPSSEAARGTQCLDRAISILVELAEQSPVGQRLVDIAEATRVSRPTAHRILKKLSDSGLVVQERGTHRYKIGPLGHRLDTLDARNTRFVARSRPGLERIAAETGLTTLLATRNGRFCALVARVDGAEGNHPAYGKSGTSGILGPTALGVAILARLRDEQVDDILFENEWTIAYLGHSTLDLIWTKIREARASGYSISCGQFVEGVTSVAVPIVSPSGHCHASIAVVSAKGEALAANAAAVASVLQREARLIAVDP